jgi:hypothetical protein
MAMTQKQLTATWQHAHLTDDYESFATVFAELSDEHLAKHANYDFTSYRDDRSGCVNGPRAWQAEVRRRNQARVQRAQQETIDAERATKLQKLKDSMPYSDEAAQEICERIAVGELLINICELYNMPTMRRCNQWLNSDSAFNALYQSALNDRLNVFEEQVVQIADDMARDFKTVIKNGVEKRVFDPEMVARAKLRIEVRFRHLKAGRPSKWGDISTLVTKSADPFDVSGLSSDELDKCIADLEKKDATVKKVA